MSFVTLWLHDNEFSWENMRAHKYSWMLMSAYDQPWALISMVPWHHEHLRALMSAHGHSWALISPHECSGSLMIIVPWCQEYSWALKITHGTLEPYSWVLLSAKKWSWVVMRAHCCSWALECMIQNFLKMLTCSILPISQSRFHKMLKNLIFLRSTQKGPRKLKIQ